MNTPWIGLEINDEIGSGSFGQVYSVHLENKEYALKIIKIPQDDNEINILLKKLGDKTAVMKYLYSIAVDCLAEIRIMKNLLGNPNIVSIKDYRLAEEDMGYTIYIIMELLESFSNYEIEHQIDEKQAIKIGTDICNALIECEKNHIIHRDLKPDNILVDKDGTYKICDFGVAKNLEKSISNQSIKGTFSFMAPEIYHGKKYDHRVDIYSLGMILYRLMNRGRDSFIDPERPNIRYKEKEQAINKRMNGEELPLPIDASDGFADIIMKATAYYPNNRYQTAEKMKADLEKLQAGNYNTRKKVRYGRIKKKDVIKGISVACIVILILLASCYKGMDIYKDNQKIYNKALKKQYEDLYYKNEKEKYTIQAYVDGHGTLHIFDDRDFINNFTYEEFIETQNPKFVWDDINIPIKKIVISKNVTTIPDDAFVSCSSLKEIIFPKNLSSIGKNAFEHCQNLSTITGLNHVNIIGDNCFEDTAWAEQEEKYLTLCNHLLYYKGGKIADDIPDYVDSIDNSSFINSDIEEIHLDDSIKYIGSSAFYNCTNLKKINLPPGLTNINFNMFYKCYNLETLEIDKKIDFGIITVERSRQLLDTKWGKKHIKDGYLILNDSLLCCENDEQTINK